MVDYTPHNRPSEEGRRPYEHVRDTTVVKTGNTGVMAAVVLFVLLAVAAFVFWTADETRVVETTAPAAQVNEQVAPDADASRPAPAPDAPLIAPDAAAPAETAPAPATGD
ncbi:hypothetical protein SAMN05877838_1675 [Hoeflea halophila]|uniref:Uncharacterized protein n=1 Tax=Hoeflea halophila TaxID=714899 RepID=A0A286I9J1_9HYPH|nr:hypothetical protein [Hoeflea halophila]SOE16793.1 hypothetical protein SAMN05877838_1675 [Hoeflea halophila]